MLKGHAKGACCPFETPALSRVPCTQKQSQFNEKNGDKKKMSQVFFSMHVFFKG
jgi:hypothetical protein